MLVPCHLKRVSCIFLLKGQLHCGTQKGFGRPDGPQEESHGLKRSVGLSTSRHHFIPQARTTAFFPPGSRSFPARFPSPDQGLAVLVPPASARLVLCRLDVQGHDGLASLCSCASRRPKGKRQGKQAGQPPAACSKQDLRQEETVRALKGVAGQHSAPGSRPTLGMTIMLLAELGIET